MRTYLNIYVHVLNKVLLFKDIGNFSFALRIDLKRPLEASGDKLYLHGI